MSLIVQKYGGSSVATFQKIQFVAKKIKKYFDQGHRLVVVVSAMGKTTDELLQKALTLHPSPPERELDMLLSTGEQVSIALLAIALDALGIPSVSLTGGQAGIITTDLHTKAKIIHIDTHRILKSLGQNKVVIIAGFQGKNLRDDITTLGRGGSDITACALAYALKADFCEIFTDVNGVFTADPRIVPQASKINQISYDEMSEMANLGAKVMQPRAVDFAHTYKVKVHVRCTFDSQEGTWIEEVSNMENARVRAVTHSGDVIKVVLQGVPDKPGIAAQIFEILANLSVSIDMINTSNLRISCLIPKGKMEESVRALHREFIEKEKIEVETNG
ncbi:MAG: aspartate kinase [Candidatus Atribacteria bacterium]|nr:aspartate kinase [Candidatus Atribacteria bacterium]MCD6349937.1 aspartate kinase [Candidatus Atribacteria bacterium]